MKRGRRQEPLAASTWWRRLDDPAIGQLVVFLLPEIVGIGSVTALGAARNEAGTAMHEIDMGDGIARVVCHAIVPLSPGANIIAVVGRA